MLMCKVLWCVKCSAIDQVCVAACRLHIVSSHSDCMPSQFHTTITIHKSSHRPKVAAPQGPAEHALTAYCYTTITIHKSTHRPRVAVRLVRQQALLSMHCVPCCYMWMLMLCTVQHWVCMSCLWPLWSSRMHRWVILFGRTRSQVLPLSYFLRAEQACLL